MVKIYDSNSTNDNDEAIVEVSQSALPVGASTEAKQDTGNTSLSSIDSKTHENKQCTGNSTNTPLGVSGVYTGSFDDAEQYSSLNVVAVTDQYSAIDGATIEFSTDGTVGGIVRTIRTTIIPTTDGIFFSIPVEARYFRIKYTNGAVAQTVFKFQCVLKKEPAAFASIPVLSPVDDLTTVLLTKSVIAGKSTETGLYENITTTDGRIRVQAISVPELLSERFRLYAENGGSNDLNVDGDPTPVEFIVPADATDELIVDFLSFQAFDSGIKIDKFLGRNAEISNGILVEIKSEDKLFQFKPIKNTTEFNSLFAFGSGRSFDLVFASGNDSMVATFGPASPFIIKPQGTYGTDDYIKIIIQDDISAVSRLRFLAGGRVK